VKIISKEGQKHKKNKQNTFQRFIKTGEVLKNSRKMKKEKRNPQSLSADKQLKAD
jgi:hypothetical protein